MLTEGEDGAERGLQGRAGQARGGEAAGGRAAVWTAEREVSQGTTTIFWQRETRRCGKRAENGEFALMATKKERD